MSNRASGGKSGPPAHQNTTAFRHNKHSKKTHMIQQIPISGMCAHCVAVVEWRKKYRKYKPLTQPKKCTMCELRKVHQAYHTVCSDCAFAKAVCAKCLEAREILPTTRRSDAEKEAVVNAEREILATLRERERRTYLRKAHRSRRAANADGTPGSGSDSGSQDDDDEDDEDDDDEDDDVVGAGPGSRAGAGAAGGDGKTDALLAAAEAERRAGREWRQQQAMMKPAADSESDEDDGEDDGEDDAADGGVAAPVAKSLEAVPEPSTADRAVPAQADAASLVQPLATLAVAGPDATTAAAAAAAAPAVAGGTPAARPIAVARKRILR